MLPDRVSNPGPLTYELGALPIALRSPAINKFYLSVPYVVTLGLLIRVNLLMQFLWKAYTLQGSHWKTLRHFGEYVAE